MFLVLQAVLTVLVRHRLQSTDLQKFLTLIMSFKTFLLIKMLTVEGKGSNADVSIMK